MEKQEAGQKFVPGWVTALAVAGLLGFWWLLARLSGGGEPAPQQVEIPSYPPASSAVVASKTTTPTPKPTVKPTVAPIAKATLVSYRMVPFRTAQGKDTSMLMVEWKNTGTVPLRVVKADIDVFDAAGNRLASSADDYDLYIESRDKPGVQPGQTFCTKQGEGYVLLAYDGIPAKVRVRIKSVAERANNI